MQSLSSAPTALPLPVSRPISRVLFVGQQATESAIEAIDGVRLVVVPLADAAAYIRGSMPLDTVWIEHAEAIDAATFVGLSEAIAERNCTLICEATLAAFDLLEATLSPAVSVQWLIDPDAIDRRIAAAAAANRTTVSQVRDIVDDATTERIDRLQEEVARISCLLRDIVARQGGLAGTPPPTAYGEGDDRLDQVRAASRGFTVAPPALFPDPPSVDQKRAKMVRKLLRQRRMRDRFFSAELFSDPAWDMLLDLFAARLERQSVSVSSLCIAAAVPGTTALRWVRTMTEANIFVRHADPQDGRRIFIALADAAFESMTRYFQAFDE